MAEHVHKWLSASNDVWIPLAQGDEPLEDGVIAGYAQAVLNHKFFVRFMSLVIILNLIAAAADQVPPH